MNAKTQRDIAHKASEARILLARARKLLDTAHVAYRDAAPLTPAETDEWRAVIRLLSPLDDMYQSGALDRD